MGPRKVTEPSWLLNASQWQMSWGDSTGGTKWLTGVMKTRWKELPHEPQEDCHSSYNSALAALVAPSNRPMVTQSYLVGTLIMCTTRVGT